MIKGIKGCGFYDVLVVPIIENTARECELTESLEKAVLKYPETQAVLVRRHGIYVWGDNWIQAKTQAECYHYLFEAACKMKAAGIPYQVAPSTEVRACVYVCFVFFFFWHSVPSFSLFLSLYTYT